MAGLYLHIPFCRKACHYCDFHFSTNLRNKFDLIKAIGQEWTLRRHELEGQTIDTIYIGGGTPSLLSKEEFEYLNTKIFKQIHDFDGEFTLEVNPEDVTLDNIATWQSVGVNRLSIGLQAMDDRILKRMNRAHSVEVALNALTLCKAHFNNLSIDLIYGFPELTLDNWKNTLNHITEYDIQHLSSYALTIEDRTALKTMIAQNKYPKVSDTQSSEHYAFLLSYLPELGMEFYEISNFAKPGFQAQHNTAYWAQTDYLGLGPAAHSLSNNQRKWNVSNNALYLKSISHHSTCFESETLSKKDRFNEYIMTGLRTKWGVDLNKITTEFGPNYLHYLNTQAKELIENEYLEANESTLLITPKGRFLSDGIAADLFYVDEN